MTPERIARELGGARKSGAGWVARCPAHDDRNPSLSLSERNGKLLVHCFAGCPQDAVIDALRDRGLWPEPERREPPKTAKPKPRASKRNQAGPIVAEYIYTNAAGNPLFRVTRHEPKDFRRWRPDGKGGWLAGTKGIPEVLYRLREVVEAAVVFIVEGEKDVETLREHGFVATCNPGGAGKWRPEFAEWLRGKTVIVVPDADEPGRKHAEDIIRSLRYKAARIIRLDLSDDGVKDITEWFAREHSEVELCAILDHAWDEAPEEVR